MVVSYINRYKDKIIFEDLGNEIKMTNFSEHFRYGYNLDDNGDKIYEMVDPSGGPYIGINTDLEKYFNDGKERIIESIDIQENAIFFKLK
jgi:hypothetical protein